MTQEKRPQFKSSHIDAPTLLAAVQNTAPFLFNQGSGRWRSGADEKALSYIQILNEPKPNLDHDLWNYYELCIASHFATVGTFVPTDVDLSIRQKLWGSVHQSSAFDVMWQMVQDFRNWDESPVSRRWVLTPSGKKLSGHQGEWLSIAMGAYGASLKVAHDRTAEIREEIETLVIEHEQALTELRDELLDAPTREKMKAYLGGVAAVAHNLGDLDRMFEAWNIGDHDVLKRRVFRSSHEDARNPRAIFLEAGVVYQALLANENHRHFALREPKGLRKSSEFLLNFGPFLDEWGERIVKVGMTDGVLTELDLREIVEALVLGWKKLNVKSIYTSQGYARALYGMAKALADGRGFARGKTDLENLLPPLIAKEFREGGIGSYFSQNQMQFEQQWLKKTLLHLVK